MLPFRVSFQPGHPIYEQVVHAAKKAILSGAIAPGERFPSVRALSQGLKINPSTAHKVVSQLVTDRLLEVHSTLGTIVAERTKIPGPERARLLNGQIEQLVVAAKTIGVELDDLLARLTKSWSQLQPHSDSVKVRP